MLVFVVDECAVGGIRVCVERVSARPLIEVDVLPWVPYGLPDGDMGRADFDLAYTKINERRIEKIWLDVILDRPQMSRIAIWDLVVMRAPRANPNSRSRRCCLWRWTG